jgi:VWFA-related protein
LLTTADCSKITAGTAVRAKPLALLLILVAAAGTAYAQHGNPVASPAAEDQPRPVRVVVTVTDRQGKPIGGLTAKDFELRDDTVVQHIESSEPRTPQPHRLALLLDEFHVAEADAPRVRQALARFVDEQLRPQDLVVVLKPLDSLPSIRLIGDRDAIHAAISTFEGRAGNYAPRSPLEEQTVGRSPALAEAARAQIVLSAMRALANRLGTQAGRPAIVLVSEGFAQEPRFLVARALPDLGNVERSANRYDVPVYAIDPREGTTGDAEPDEPQLMLRRLASQTGGRFSTGADLTASLNQMGRELDAGYLLSYRPSHGEDGKFHEIDVRVARRDVQVRTRAGYVSPPSPEVRRAMQASLAPSFEPMRLLRRSPQIDVWSGITRAENGMGRVVVTWEPGRPFAGKTKSSAARVSLKATTRDGTLLFEGVLAPVRNPIETAAVPSDRAEFNAPSGRVQLDMTILDEGGGKLDEDARDLEIPNLTGPGTLLLPPVLLATRSAREFREVSADANAAPAPAREFSRTERLVIRVPAYAPGSQDPRVTARLLNRAGQLMREIEPVPGLPASGVTQFDLPLASFAPGDYFLVVTATGAAGAAEQRVSLKITG